VIALNGLGAVVFGAAATSLGVPAAYALAGASQVVAGLAGLGYGRAHPGALDIGRPEQVPAPLGERDQSG